MLLLSPLHGLKAAGSSPWGPMVSNGAWMFAQISSFYKDTNRIGLGPTLYAISSL